MKLTCVVLIALDLLLVCDISAQNRKPHISPEPNWVTKIQVNYKIASLDIQAENGYIDLDYEKQVSLPTRCVYIRRSMRILSEAGVQNASQVSISFDPSYQQLIFHTIKIIRDGKIINKLDLSKIKTIQQEKDLDNFIYNGTLNAVLFLEDVRKGDILEYSYTKKGFNSIFKDKYSDVYGTRFSSPFYCIYYKLITPPDKNINIKNSIETTSPDKYAAAGNTVYEWKKINIAALHVEDNIPSWYDPYPEVMVSEYNSWKEVNDWALEMFPGNCKLSAALKNKIGEIQSENVTSENQVLAALHFVQDDIRYMGIEMGEHSHKPMSPNKVFEQRFGDCKEKSYLLCAMLNTMDIEAAPVLINTDYKKTILSWLPSSTDFDHATVRVKLNGKFYWFDPTISYQRGNIGDISYPDYQCGLVLTDTTTALTLIPSHAIGDEQVKEIFTIPDMSGTARLEVITTYSGDYADIVRNDFKNNSLYEMQKTYQDFYVSYFDETTSDSLTFSDNEPTGIFMTKEFYTIKHFWDEKNGFKKVSISPFVIESVLQTPKNKQRTMPFAIQFPADYHEEMIINFPEEWRTRKLASDLKCSGFVMNANSSSSNRQVVLKYDYRSLKDFITPSEAGDYFASIEKTKEKLNYALTYNGSTAGEAVAEKGSRRIGYVALIVSFLIAGIVWWTQKKDKPV